jgi:Na+-translocating ferredoxin:NAD+ oxidoreductase RnfG subunit
MKKKLTNLEKFGLIAAVIIAGSYFYLGKVYDPQMKKLKKTISEHNKIVSRINALDAFESELIYEKKIEKAKKEVKALDEKLEQLTMKSSTDKSALLLLEKKLVKTAENSGIIFESITPNGEIKDLFNWHIYNMKANCRFISLINFLKKIRDFKDPAQIGKLKIEKTDKSGILKIEMEVMI